MNHPVLVSILQEIVRLWIFHLAVGLRSVVRQGPACGTPEPGLSRPYLNGMRKVARNQSPEQVPAAAYYISSGRQRRLM